MVREISIPSANDLSKFREARYTVRPEMDLYILSG
jgi:hypothetical protein